MFSFPFTTYFHLDASTCSPNISYYFFSRLFFGDSTAPILLFKLLSLLHTVAFTQSSHLPAWSQEPCWKPSLPNSLSKPKNVKQILFTHTFLISVHGFMNSILLISKIEIWLATPFHLFCTANQSPNLLIAPTKFVIYTSLLARTWVDPLPPNITSFCYDSFIYSSAVNCCPSQ